MTINGEESEEIVGGLAIIPEVTSDLAEKLGQPNRPYFYHTTRIETLPQIFQSGILKSSGGSPIMFTADQVDSDSGRVLVNGLTDPSFQYLVGRQLQPGRTIFVYDGQLVNQPSFQHASPDRRYPQVQEATLKGAKVLIVLPEDRATVEKIAGENKSNLQVVTKEEWEKYAYIGNPESHLEGGLA